MPLIVVKAHDKYTSIKDWPKRRGCTTEQAYQDSSSRLRLLPYPRHRAISARAITVKLAGSGTGLYAGLKVKLEVWYMDISDNIWE